MRQPEITKSQILEQAGALFNTQGYNATSLSDITDATGLTKGAIYRHFTSKEGLEVASLENMFAQVDKIIIERVKKEKTAPAKLKAVLQLFESYTYNPIIKGGCPLLNSAIEVDDNNPKLRQVSVSMLKKLKFSIAHILNNGIKYQQIKPDTNTESLASIIICGLEGGIMTSKLCQNTEDINNIVAHLNHLIDQVSTHQ
jgi:TetR/AcrR family transcriptional regulator, transcriptional repressor for nem operon